MASSQEVQEIIELGTNLQINRRLIAGLSALWFYDYFLTLPDEIEFAWPGKKSFVFWLFTLVPPLPLGVSGSILMGIKNRYWPVWYILWTFVAYLSPGHTNLEMCHRTAWFPMLYFVFATFFSQVAITLRIYAVTGNNRLIAGCLSFLSSVQFSFGIYLSIRFALRGPLPIPDVPLEEYQVCATQRWRAGEIVYTALMALYDCAAFLVIVFSARKRGHMHAAGVPSLLECIVKDATIYFLVVFGGQLLVIFFDLLAPVQIQTFPASANAIVVPMMITRLILSLRKAANAQSWVPSSNYPSWTAESIRFAQQTVGGTECVRDAAPSRTESVKLSHRVIGRAEYGDDIALKHISPERRVGLSSGHD